jgi:hypothetical protein
MPATKNGRSLWDLLRVHIVDPGSNYDDDGEHLNFPDRDAAATTALLRVMVLRSDPPPMLENELSAVDARVVQEGARLRARLQVYLARRQALLEEHCPLIGPLRAMVHGYEVPTTTEDFWATGLGADPLHPLSTEAHKHVN